VKTSKYFETDI